MATEGDLRLDGGINQYIGILDIFHAGTWLPVCDDNWSFIFAEEQALKNANVACGQLFGTDALDVTTEMLSGFMNYWLDDVACTGAELALSDCPSAGWGIENCFPTEGIILECAIPSTAALTAPPATVPATVASTAYATNADEGTIRLTDSIAGLYQGRLEINHNGVWGGICDDEWVLAQGDNNAGSVCSQLYGTAAVSWLPAYAVSAPASGVYWLDTLECATDDKTDIYDECPHDAWGIHDCTIALENVYIVCAAPATVGATVQQTDQATVQATIAATDGVTARETVNIDDFEDEPVPFTESNITAILRSDACSKLAFDYTLANWVDGTAWPMSTSTVLSEIIVAMCFTIHTTIVNGICGVPHDADGHVILGSNRHDDPLGGPYWLPALFESMYNNHGAGWGCTCLKNHRVMHPTFVTSVGRMTMHHSLACVHESNFHANPTHLWMDDTWDTTRRLTCTGQADGYYPLGRQWTRGCSCTTNILDAGFLVDNGRDLRLQSLPHGGVTYYPHNGTFGYMPPVCLGFEHTYIANGTTPLTRSAQSSRGFTSMWTGGWMDPVENPTRPLICGQEFIDLPSHPYNSENMCTYDDDGDAQDEDDTPELATTFLDIDWADAGVEAVFPSVSGGDASLFMSPMLVSACPTVTIGISPPIMLGTCAFRRPPCPCWLFFCCVLNPACGGCTTTPTGLFTTAAITTTATLAPSATNETTAAPTIAGTNAATTGPGPGFSPYPEPPQCPGHPDCAGSPFWVPPCSGVDFDYTLSNWLDGTSMPYNANGFLPYLCFTNYTKIQFGVCGVPMSNTGVPVFGAGVNDDPANPAWNDTVPSPSSTWSTTGGGFGCVCAAGYRIMMPTYVHSVGRFTMHHTISCVHESSWDEDDSALWTSGSWDRTGRTTCNGTPDGIVNPGTEYSSGCTCSYVVAVMTPTDPVLIDSAHDYWATPYAYGGYTYYPGNASIAYMPPYCNGFEYGFIANSTATFDRSFSYVWSHAWESIGFSPMPLECGSDLTSQPPGLYPYDNMNWCAFVDYRIQWRTYLLVGWSGSDVEGIFPDDDPGYYVGAMMNDAGCYTSGVSGGGVWDGRCYMTRPPCNCQNIWCLAMFDPHPSCMTELQTIAPTADVTMTAIQTTGPNTVPATVVPTVGPGPGFTPWEDIFCPGNPNCPNGGDFWSPPCNRTHFDYVLANWQDGTALPYEAYGDGLPWLCFTNETRIANGMCGVSMNGQGVPSTTVNINGDPMNGAWNANPPPDAGGAWNTGAGGYGCMCAAGYRIMYPTFVHSRSRYTMHHSIACVHESFWNPVASNLWNTGNWDFTRRTVCTGQSDGEVPLGTHWKRGCTCAAEPQLTQYAAGIDTAHDYIMVPYQWGGAIQLAGDNNTYYMAPYCNGFEYTYISFVTAPTRRRRLLSTPAQQMNRSFTAPWSNAWEYFGYTPAPMECGEDFVSLPVSMTPYNNMNWCAYTDFRIQWRTEIMINWASSDVQNIFIGGNPNIYLANMLDECSPGSGLIECYFLRPPCNCALPWCIGLPDLHPSCVTELPTGSPEILTAAPTTASVTVQPTSQITAAPTTASVTVQPTSQITAAATTASVTVQPTSQITAAPTTASVTVQPTSQITAAATTASVTVQPTSQITAAATTAQVTVVPTDPLTADLTTAPGTRAPTTAQETVAPTAALTRTPTTMQETVAPTAALTRTPTTMQETVAPTAALTRTPTTMQETVASTAVITDAPTTMQQTVIPTTRVTDAPTTAPYTIAPTSTRGSSVVPTGPAYTTAPQTIRPTGFGVAGPRFRPLRFGQRVFLPIVTLFLAVAGAAIMGMTVINMGLSDMV